MNAPVRIVAYDPRWPGRYQQAQEFFGSVLEDTIHSIHHIGSTSVPGLASKDRIDLQITLADPPSVAPFQEALRAAGLPEARPKRDHRPAGDTSPEADWEKLYLGGINLGFAMNVHVRFRGRRNQEYPLLFRDFLREHPDSAAAYADFKRKLSLAVEDRDLYCDLKDPVCDLILHEAKRWATRTGWTQRLS